MSQRFTGKQLWKLADAMNVNADAIAANEEQTYDKWLAACSGEEVAQ